MPGHVQHRPGLVQHRPGVVQHHLGLAQHKRGIVQPKPGLTKCMKGHAVYTGRHKSLLTNKTNKHNHAEQTKCVKEIQQFTINDLFL